MSLSPVTRGAYEVFTGRSQLCHLWLQSYKWGKVVCVKSSCVKILPLNARYVISVSNKFLTWDLASSEICRDVDPQMEGLMMGQYHKMNDTNNTAFSS